jgi:hypothetical protein
MIFCWRWRARLGALTAVLMVTAVTTTIGPLPASADHLTPPSFPANCPAAQFPPAGYSPSGKAMPYEVPFKGIIHGGEIQIPSRGSKVPNIIIPNLNAAVCGLVELPQLLGTIQPSGVDLAPPNVYVAEPGALNRSTRRIEAVPASVQFGVLTATIDPKPAHNGGLDITLTGISTASVSELGMTCGITLNAKFTTLTDGVLSGQPVTGPTMDGQAEVVSNSFEVPTVKTSSTCPAAIAQTFNRLLGLPVPPGVGTFVSPFCFDFELEGINSPAPTKTCPWP